MYYETNDYNKKINYLIGLNIITKDGIYNQISGTTPLKQKNTGRCFKKCKYKFELITQLKFNDKYNNL